jgi:hypothetical protein
MRFVRKSFLLRLDDKWVFYRRNREGIHGPGPKTSADFSIRRQLSPFCNICPTRLSQTCALLIYP